MLITANGAADRSTRGGSARDERAQGTFYDRIAQDKDDPEGGAAADGVDPEREKRVRAVRAAVREVRVSLDAEHRGGVRPIPGAGAGADLRGVRGKAQGLHEDGQGRRGHREEAPDFCADSEDGQPERRVEGLGREVEGDVREEARAGEGEAGERGGDG